MINQKRDKGGHCCFEHSQQPDQLRFQICRGIKTFPQSAQSIPLLMRIKRVAHGSTQLDANPWNWMWIVKVDTKHKDAWQANHRHKSRRGCDSHSGDRPEIGYNFGDPTLVETPGYLFRPALSLHPLQ